MALTIIDWDGTTVPDDFRVLPPGRYMITPLDDDGELSPEEDAAVQAGLDHMDAGRVVSHEVVMEDIRRLSQG